MICGGKDTNCLKCLSDSVCALCEEGYAVLKAQCVKLPFGFNKVKELEGIPYGYYEEFGILERRPSLTDSAEDHKGVLSNTTFGSVLIVCVFLLMLVGVVIILFGIYLEIIPDTKTPKKEQKTVIVDQTI